MEVEEKEEEEEALLNKQLLYIAGMFMFILLWSHVPHLL